MCQALAALVAHRSQLLASSRYLVVKVHKGVASANVVYFFFDIFIITYFFIYVNVCVHEVVVKRCASACSNSSHRANVCAVDKVELAQLFISSIG